jgi:LacI family transcriptional regulator
MNALLELNKMTARPTAVMCSNDMTAIGVLREAYEQNIKIPDDLSVVGFDDIHLAEFTIPPLTTVQMSQHGLAEIAFNALLNEVENSTPPREQHSYELVTSLVLRKSTALARAVGSAIIPEKSNRTTRHRKAAESSAR